MLWRVALVVGAVVAIVCAGVAIYADDQPAESRCVERRELQRGDPGYTDPATARNFDEYRNLGECVAYDDAPLPILRSGTTSWWWFGAAAAVVLTAASIPLLRRR
jgi:hypothetical protein